LAETLITLTIIGILASILISPLLKNIQNNDFKTRWRQTYAQISTAYNSIVYEHGGSLAEYYTADDAAMPLINDFADKMAVSKKCISQSGINYLCTNPSIILTSGTSGSYKSLDGGGSLPGWNLTSGQLVLNNGITLFFRLYDSNFSLIWADMNGYEKGPNTIGVDLFGVMISKNWLKPMGTIGTGATVNTCNTTPATCHWSEGFHNGSSCAGAGCSAEYLYK